MMAVMFTGHLSRPVMQTESSRWEGSIRNDEDNRSARLLIKRKAIAQQLIGLPNGTQVALAGLLHLIPVINEQGEPRVHITIEVTAVMTAAPEKTFLQKLFKRK